MIMEQINLSRKTKEKQQATVFRESKPPKKMDDMGMRVEGGWSMLHDAYTKADAFGVFDPKHDQPPDYQKRGGEDDTSHSDPQLDVEKTKFNLDSPEANPKCDSCGNRPGLQRSDHCTIGGKCAF